MRQSAAAKPLLMPEGAPVLLRDLIQERLGIFFESDRLDYMVERIMPLAENLGCYSFLDYFYHLKYDESSAPEWEKLMEALSVQETYFWREISQVKALTEHVVPAWFDKGNRPLRIWSAAAATGEEAYGLAIALLEAGYGDHPIEIAASDFSALAIQKAKQGLYRENSFRAFPHHIREKYFQRKGNLWQLNDEVVRRVQFHKANLMAPEEVSGFARSPVIFCRNVFIYFSAYSIRQTVANFASRMPKNGYLFIGASESLLRLTTDFELREVGDAFVYVRV